MSSTQEKLIVVVIAVALFVSFISGYLIGKDVGAMEVYKGNTRMQYTIIDSVKVDSCVIFK